MSGDDDDDVNVNDNPRNILYVGRRTFIELLLRQDQTRSLADAVYNKKLLEWNQKSDIGNIVESLLLKIDAQMKGCLAAVVIVSRLIWNIN